MPIEIVGDKLALMLRQRCLHLFALLLLLLVTVPFLEGTPPGRVVLNAINVFILIAATAAVARSGLALLIAFLLAGATVVFQGLGFILAKHAPGPAPSIRTCALIAMSAALFGCGGSGGQADPMGPSSPPLSYLELFPAQRVAVIGETMTYAVIARDLAGTDVPNVVPAYSSANPGVVAIDPAGRIVGSGAGTTTVRASAGGQVAETLVHVGPATYDLAALGPPRVLDANYIDLSKIERISRFRSAIGHSYVDGSGETCRSMKHYYQPKLSVDWTAVDVYAPASGTIWLIAPDGAAGYRVMLRPRDLAALNVAIFHVNLDPGIVKDTWVDAGGRIGRHASSFTMSDIATDIGGKQTGTLLSYFHTMTDSVFAQYQARGVASREASIITKEERDADPVPCVGEQQFPAQGTLPNWVVLN